VPESNCREGPCSVLRRLRLGGFIEQVSRGMSCGVALRKNMRVGRVFVGTRCGPADREVCAKAECKGEMRSNLYVWRWCTSSAARAHFAQCTNDRKQPSRRSDIVLKHHPGAHMPATQPVGLLSRPVYSAGHYPVEVNI